MRHLLLHAREQRERRRADIRAMREAEEHESRMPAQRGAGERVAPCVSTRVNSASGRGLGNEVPDFE